MTKLDILSRIYRAEDKARRVRNEMPRRIRDLADSITQLAQAVSDFLRTRVCGAGAK